MRLHLCTFGIAAIAISLCSATAVAQSLYWSDPSSSQIRNGETNGAGSPNALFDADDGISVPGPIALDEVNGFIYFVDTETAIKRGNLDGTGTPVTLFNAADGLANVHSLAIDVANGRIYWGDISTNRIMVGNIDGSGLPSILFDEFDNVSEPVDIDVDPANGFIYWADFGSKNVQRGNIDGTETPIELFGDTDTRGVAIDPIAGKVFWTDFLGSEVLSGNIDGSGSPTVLFDVSNTVATPRDVDHDPTRGTLFWVNGLFTQRIQSGPDGGGGPAADVYSAEDGVESVGYIAITAATPPPLPPPGVPNYGIVWSDVDMFAAHFNGLFAPTSVYSSANGLDAPKGLVADFSTGVMYWTQRYSPTPLSSYGAIMVGHLSGTVAPNVLYHQWDGFRVDDPEGLTADFENGKLYWADSGRIFGANIDGTGTPVVLAGEFPEYIRDPISIVIDVDNGKIYWTDRGNPYVPQPPKIEVKNIDGSGSPTVLFDDTDGLESTYGLDIDFDAGLMYWTDVDGAKVQVGNLDGSGSPTDLYTAADGLVDPRGIALDPHSGMLVICDQLAEIIALAHADGSGIVELYGGTDGVDAPEFVIINPEATVSFGIEGLPTADFHAQALTAAAVLVIACCLFLRRRWRTRKWI